MLSVLMPGSAVSAIWSSCHVAALICAITAIALGVEQYREMRSSEASNSKRINAYEEKTELRYVMLVDQMNAMQEMIKSVDYDEIKARSEEIKSALSTLKLNNLYSRK